MWRVFVSVAVLLCLTVALVWLATAQRHPLAQIALFVLAAGTAFLTPVMAVYSRYPVYGHHRFS